MNEETAATEPVSADAATDAAAQQAPQPVDETPQITLGFTRGVAPSKWLNRWNAMSPDLTLAITPFGKPYGRPGNAGDFDMVIERTAPGETPKGSTGDGVRTHHSMRLYNEALAVVLPKDHDFAEFEQISLEDLAGVRLLDHPNHSPEWPAAEPWDDPEWMPKSLLAALELVATGLGGILMPAPLARHIMNKKQHVLVRISDPVVAGTVWASWLVDRDAPDVQQLAGVLRGRTARSSRSADHEEAVKAAKAARTPKVRQPQKAKPKLKANSRGAQLQAAVEKREREKAERRKLKKGKR